MSRCRRTAAAFLHAIIVTAFISGRSGAATVFNKGTESVCSANSATSCNVLDDKTDEAAMIQLGKVNLKQFPVLPPCTGSCQVTITGWVGRIGNNIVQLGQALLQAVQIGAQTLQPPSSGGQMNKLFSLPAYLQLAPLAATILPPLAQPCCFENSTLNESLLSCDFWHLAPSCLFDPSSDFKEQTQARLLQTFVKPFLTTAGQEACSLEFVAGAMDDSVLVVHLRGGDVMLDDQSNMLVLNTFTNSTAEENSTNLSMVVESLVKFRQPACAMYSAIVNGLGYGPGDFVGWSKIRLVMRDRTNPCAAWLENEFPDKVEAWQARTLQEDACTLMNARNLVMSNSLFAKAFGMSLNELHPRVFIPVDPGEHALFPISFAGAPSSLWAHFSTFATTNDEWPRTNTLIAINVPGLATFRPLANDRKAWMTNVSFPIDDFSVSPLYS